MRWFGIITLKEVIIGIFIVVAILSVMWSQIDRAIKVDCPNVIVNNFTQDKINDNYYRINVTLLDDWYIAGGYSVINNNIYVHRCEKGYKEGENLNYYYCPDDKSGHSVNSKRHGFEISKQLVSEEGVAGKTYTYEMILVIDNNGNLIERKCK